MEQSPIAEADVLSVNEAIRCSIWNVDNHCQAHKIAPLVLLQAKYIHSLLSHLLLLNIILSSVSSLSIPGIFFSSGFSNKLL